MSDTSTWLHLRGRVAGLSRDRAPDDPELIQARRDLKETRIGLYITKAVSEMPELTKEQRGRLALLLLRGNGDGRV